MPSGPIFSAYPHGEGPKKAAACLNTTPEKGAIQMDFKPMTEYLNSLVPRDVVGLGCRIYVKNALVFEHYAGFADREKGVFIAPDTRYNLYSASKVATCAAAMQLCERGVIALDDPISRYLPEFESMTVALHPNDAPRPAARPITVRHLMTMTAGLTYQMDTPQLERMLAQTGGQATTRQIAQAIAQTLPPWLAGVAIIGPIAASISTVSSLLIASSSAIIKDVYLHHCESSGKKPTERKIARSSQAVTLCVGAIVFVLAIVPPDVIWKINMFAFGGLETAFFWVLVCGLFWKRAGKWGALLSMIGGSASYCLCMALGFKVMGLHQIVIGITVAGVLMVLGSLLGRRDAAEEKRMREVFFPE